MKSAEMLLDRYLLHNSQSLQKPLSDALGSVHFPKSKSEDEKKTIQDFLAPTSCYPDLVLYEALKH